MIRLSPVVAAIVLALAAGAWADPQHKMYGAEKYDKSKEVTITGVVERVERHRSGSHAGLHLLLRTEEKTIEVHVGPVTYLQERRIQFQVGEEITVVGARTRFGDETVIVPREIKTPAEIVVLRDENGVPMWSGKYRTGL
jgi:hypothetical protein